MYSVQVGIGAFVVNSKREVLVVQERLGPLKGSVSNTLTCSPAQFGTSAVTLLIQHVSRSFGNVAISMSAPVHNYATGCSD